MKTTWAKSLMIWAPVALVLSVGAALCESCRVAVLRGFLLLPARFLSFSAEVHIWSTEPGMRSPFEWFHNAVAIIYWPIILIPLLGWLKTRNRVWLIPQTLLFLAHISIIFFFVLLWRNWQMD